jgi:serine/threonine protein kinase
MDLAVLEDGAGMHRTVSVQRLRREAGPSQRISPGFSPDGLLGCHVRHPNVFSVLDVIESKGELLLVMEYVVSETLRRLETGGSRLPLPISIAIARGVLQALTAAHGARGASGEHLQIVHSNIDPDNILIGADGSPRLVHFGRAAKQRVARPLAAVAKGKSRYIAPEQVFDQDVDARTDVFQVGIVLWESLTGKQLIAGGSAVDCMLRFISNGARPPSEANPRVGRSLDAVLLKALEPTPERRFQTAAEFAQALEAAATFAPRAEVARYVEAVAGASVQEQRSLLGEVPVEETPTTCVRLTSMFREVSEFRPIQNTVPDEVDEPTAALGQFLDNERSSEVASHWSSRDANELTAVDGAAHKPTQPLEPAPSRLRSFEAPARASGPMKALPTVSTPDVRAARSAKLEIASSSPATVGSDGIELADATSDFDESWVHPAPLLMTRAAAHPLSDTLAGRHRSLSARVLRGLARVITWSLAFVFVFATTFFITKLANDAAYRRRTTSDFVALVQRVRWPAAPVAKPAPPSLPNSRARVAERPAPTSSSTASKAVAPKAEPPAQRVLRLEELPLAPKVTPKKPRARPRGRVRKLESTPAAPAPAPEVTPTVTLTDE